MSWLLDECTTVRRAQDDEARWADTAPGLFTQIRRAV